MGDEIIIGVGKKTPLHLKKKKIHALLKRNKCYPIKKDILRPLGVRRGRGQAWVDGGREQSKLLLLVAFSQFPNICL